MAKSEIFENYGKFAVYIAGPMTGLPSFNYPKFFSIEKELELLGNFTQNPARICATDVLVGNYGQDIILDFGELGVIVTPKDYKYSKFKVEISYEDIGKEFEIYETTTGRGWQRFMRLDIQALTNCDKIFMLKGWEKSKGASLEFKIATELGLDILYEQ